MRDKLIVILGPTASGKSALALKLAKKFQGELINADSRQIYKEMDIGTAKHVGGGTSHMLIDVVKPDQEFTLIQYKKLALKIIKDILKRGKIPFLVGGTGLYLQAVVDNLKIPPVKANQALREKLAKLTNQELFEKLKDADPETAELIDRHNQRRLIRALEVCLITKKPFSQQRKKGSPLFDILEIGLKTDPKKIDQRIETMFQEGLIQEVKRLIKKYSPDLPAFSAIGYQETIAYLNKEISLTEAKKLISQHTRQYAKRQMTWFKKDKRIHWLEDPQKAEQLIADFIF